MADHGSQDSLQTPAGTFSLQRHGAPRDKALRAWNAADELLLEAVADSNDATTQHTVLTINDTFGALSISAKASLAWTDSATSRDAIAFNAARNDQAPPEIISSVQRLPEMNAPVVVLLRIPKQLSLLEHQLQALASQCVPGTRVYAAGMDKHLSPHTAAVMEKWLGPTERHRGQRKARVFSATLAVPSIPSERSSIVEYVCEPLDARLESLPGVFSREALDRGSALLLGALESSPAIGHVIDLACGNGVLSLFSALRGDTDSVAFCDDSALAVESARRNATALLPDTVRAEFHWSNGLRDYQGPAANRIVCNPPFHSGQAVDTALGRQLIRACADHLAPGGDLWMVANRHLDYRPALIAPFGQRQIMASDKRFVVTRIRRN